MSQLHVPNWILDDVCVCVCVCKFIGKFISKFIIKFNSILHLYVYQTVSWFCGIFVFTAWREGSEAAIVYSDLQ